MSRKFGDARFSRLTSHIARLCHDRSIVSFTKDVRKPTKKNCVSLYYNRILHIHCTLVMLDTVCSTPNKFYLVFSFPIENYDQTHILTSDQPDIRNVSFTNDVHKSAMVRFVLHKFCPPRHPLNFLSCRAFIRSGVMRRSWYSMYCIGGGFQLGLLSCL